LNSEEVIKFLGEFIHLYGKENKKEALKIV
jgi:hypothetical protein